MGEFEFAVLLAILHTEDAYTVPPAGLKAIKATHAALTNLTRGLESLLDRP